MKYIMKKIYITFFFLTVLFLSTNIFAKEGKIQYKKENISNYFQGVVFSNQGINQ